MKKLTYFLLANLAFVFVVLAILFIGFIKLVHAETVVSAGSIWQNTAWTKENSPYIIEDYVNVPTGITLNIGPGVEVRGVSGDKTGSISVNGGNLIIKGQGSDFDRVSIHDLFGLSIDNGNFDISNADISGHDFFVVNNSKGIISTTTINDAFDGINIKESDILIRGSKFSRNRRAITVRPAGLPVLMMNGDIGDSVGGIGNALDNSTGPSIEIVNSSISGNYDYAIDNLSTDTVIAVNNWWGRVDGPLPASLKGDSVRGFVDFEPWLVSEPPFDPGQIQGECCSNILFLPGVEASFLYKQESLPLGIKTENTLWPPNRNDDVRKLFLDTNGKSTDPSIYSGKPIDDVFGVYSISGKFMDFLDGLASDKTINEWRPYGYDWRKPIDEVVKGPEIRNPSSTTTTENLINTVQDLASRSKTGKVTIIAHSNGGLVAKYMVKKLVDMGKESLIDSVISIAVPYLGTPQAIGGILHGDNQSLGYGIILKQYVARQLGQNMASAYSLLPSATYFANIFGPTIAFASTNIDGLNDGSYSQNIQSSSEQSAFISDSHNVRKEPVISNYNFPIKGNQALILAADIVRAVIDPFSWPSSITRWAIVGWNKNTTKSLNYSDNSGYTEGITNMGDGTVVSKSATYKAGDVLSIDLDKISDIEDKNTNHANILESTITQKIVESAIVNSNYNSLCNSVTQLQGVTCGEPDYTKEVEPVEMVISTHSPVELHVYDSSGNHTGMISRPSEVEDDVLTFFEEKIPGSRFEYMSGEDYEGETFVHLPDNGKSYGIVVNGTGIGTFTLDVERTKGGEVIDSAEYVDLPVSPSMIASTTIQVIPLSQSNTVSNPIASSSKTLFIDFDGNGVVDFMATSSSKTIDITESSMRYLELLKKLITSLIGSTNKAKSLIKRIDKLENIVVKGKEKKIIKSAKNIRKNVGHIKKGKLTEIDRKQIIETIDLFLSQFE
ncbi:MAG: hypothetical protein WCW03_03070 [Candidatus Paceibacterota bacterium]|jgi:hypothetical protein